jgi:hypothetical protein
MPITYDPPTNIITVTGFTQSVPCTFDDIYNADKAGTYELRASEQFTASQTIYLDNEVRPADAKGLIIYFNVIAFTPPSTTAVVFGYGADPEETVEHNESVTLSGVGEFRTNFHFNRITRIEVFIDPGASVTFSIFQKRWGVVWRTEAGNKKQYYFDDVKVHFGDDVTPTYFKDTNVQVTFYSSLSRWNKNFYLHKNLTFQLGEVYDATNKRGTDGCQIYAYNPNDNLTALCGWLGDNTTIVKLYGCHFSGGKFVEFRGANTQIWDCVFQTNWVYVDTPDVNRVTLIETYLENAVGGTFADLLIFGTLYGYHKRYTATFNIVDLKIRNCTYVAYLERFNGVVSLIDADSDTWTVRWRVAPWESYGSVDRKYTLNLKVLDKNGNPIEGATVTLWDKNGTQVFSVTTDVNGQIPEQTVLYARYEQDLPGTGTITTIYSPHKLEIKKAGYQDYQKEFTLDNKVDWKIKLAKAVGVFLDFGRPVINLKKTDPENKNVLVL